MARRKSETHTHTEDLKAGRKLKYETVQEFEDAVFDYLEWAKKTPVYRTITATFQGEITYRKVPVDRAMNVHSMAAHLKIAISTLMEYKKRDGYAEVYDIARTVIAGHNLDGAVSGDFSPSLVARLENLGDTHDSEGNKFRPTHITMIAGQADEKEEN